MQERFIKVNGRTYTESELCVMNEKELTDLIKECQNGIEEIERKSADYRANNYDVNNIEHYNEVLAKFKSASIFLQSDIVLINNILKSNEPSPICKELNWYKAYFEITQNCITKRKHKKICEIASEKTGYDINA